MHRINVRKRNISIHYTYKTTGYGSSVQPSKAGKTRNGKKKIWI